MPCTSLASTIIDLSPFATIYAGLAPEAGGHGAAAQRAGSARAAKDGGARPGAGGQRSLCVVACITIDTLRVAQHGGRGLAQVGCTACDVRSRPGTGWAGCHCHSALCVSIPFHAFCKLVATCGQERLDDDRMLDPEP